MLRISDLPGGNWPLVLNRFAVSSVRHIVRQVGGLEVFPQAKAGLAGAGLELLELDFRRVVESRVGVAVALADELAVEHRPIARQHVRQQAVVIVARLAGQKLQADGLAFARPRRKGRRLGPEVLDTLAAILGLRRVHAPEPDPRGGLAAVRLVDVQGVAVDHVDDAERLLVVADVVLPNGPGRQPEDADTVAGVQAQQHHRRRESPARAARGVPLAALRAGELGR